MKFHITYQRDIVATVECPTIEDAAKIAKTSMNSLPKGTCKVLSIVVDGYAGMVAPEVSDVKIVPTTPKAAAPTLHERISADFHKKWGHLFPDRETE
jgi:F0F1-type ATP synthase gamma subunit